MQFQVKQKLIISFTFFFVATCNTHMEAVDGNFVLKLIKTRARTQYFIIYPLTIILFHLSDFQEGAENKRTCYQECA